MTTNKEPFIGKKLTLEHVREILQQPNGSERLFSAPEDVFDAVWQLFVEEGSPSAASFLCRAAKRKRFREEINGKLAPARAPLCAALESENPKLRKNAARLAGELGDTADVPALAAALKREDTRFVIPSILLALGAVGGDAALKALNEYEIAPPADDAQKRHAEDEEKAKATALDSFCAPPTAEFSGLDSEYEIELRCPINLSEALCWELSQLGFEPFDVKPDRLRVRTVDYAALFAARGFREALFPISEISQPKPENIADAVREPMQRLAEEAFGKAAAPYRYRIEIRGNEARPELAGAVAKALASDAFVNSVSAYGLELRLEYGRNGGVSAFVRLAAFKDNRFDYRAEALPASISPSTAAAVIRHARQYLAQGARVLDFCCGSGTMLFERERFSACRELAGIDVSRWAVSISRKNASRAKSSAGFVVMDCLEFRPQEKFDEIIANMPFGNRVGTHGGNMRLYRGVLDKLPLWLRPDGIAVLYTAEVALVNKLITGRRDLEVLSVTRTEAGGLEPAVFIVRINNTRT